KTKTFKMITKQRLLTFTTLGLAFWYIFGTTLVGATNYRAQIQVLKDRNKTQQAQVDQLETAAHSLEEELKILRHKMYTLKRKITANQQKSAGLKRKIAQQKREIKKQRKILGINIREMYLDGDITTLE